ncbi:hypothetical protein ACFY0P_37880 [Streptomyces sp. NPDC001714]|uniref:hypothetical protein n=1 Tax=Streptomyces sp. NPDC001714 TaxID=3364603 RepID=UPI0036C0E55D
MNYAQLWTSQSTYAGATNDLPTLVAIPSAYASPASDARLYMFWRGLREDQRLFWSQYDGTGHWSPQRVINGVGSNCRPSGCQVRSGNENVPLLVWRGIEPGDHQIWWAFGHPEEQWFQNTIPGAGSSHGPSAAYANGRVYAVWKGVPGDQRIWQASRAPNEDWVMDPRPIPGVGTSSSPSLLAVGDRLYMFWKGIDGDHTIYYSWSQPGGQALPWQPQTRIDFVGTTFGPTAADYNGDIVLAWRGSGSDNNIWVTSMKNGTPPTDQTPIPGRGTAVGPSIAVWNGQLFMAWRGIGDDYTIYWAKRP